MIRMLSLIYFVGFVAGGIVFKSSGGGCDAGMDLTESECELVQTGFQSESSGALSYAPSKCYKMGITVKWDADANNTGGCGAMVSCVCSDGIAVTPPPTVSIAPAPTVAMVAPPPTVAVISTPPPTPFIIVTTTGHEDTYKIITSSEKCENIVTMDECLEAANALGVGKGEVKDDRQSNATWDPPFCYVEHGDVKFNTGGNTGPCNNVDNCICRAAIVYAQVDSGNNCNGFDVITTAGECFTAGKKVLPSAMPPIMDNANSDVDPPYCYFESGQLKFNGSGDNTGACSENDICICKFEEEDVVATVVDELSKFPGVQEVRIDHVHEEDSPNENTVDVSLFLKVYADCPNDTACTNEQTARRLLGE